MIPVDTILIIEDDASLCAGLVRALSTEKQTVQGCACLQEAREKLRQSGWSLILLDVGLPDGNGFDFLTEIKADKVHADVPVIMLTANDLESDIVTGLEQGADDYITKPFSLAILRARIQAQLRKASGRHFSQSAGMPYQCGDYLFDFEKMEFFHAGKLIELSRTEQKLLRIFTDNAGITLPRERLIDRIWTDGAAYVDENALSVTVKRLRDKLSAQEVIRTVYGIGYVWKIPERSKET